MFWIALDWLYFFLLYNVMFDKHKSSLTSLGFFLLLFDTLCNILGLFLFLFLWYQFKKQFLIDMSRRFGAYSYLSQILFPTSWLKYVPIVREIFCASRSCSCSVGKQGTLKPLIATQNHLIFMWNFLFFHFAHIALIFVICPSCASLLIASVLQRKVRR